MVEQSQERPDLAPCGQTSKIIHTMEWYARTPIL